MAEYNNKIPEDIIGCPFCGGKVVERRGPNFYGAPSVRFNCRSVLFFYGSYADGCFVCDIPVQQKVPTERDYII